MSETTVANSESAILARVIVPKLTGEAIHSILEIEFSESDRGRINYLAEKAREGTLSENERTELENFERVGHLISILKSKARQALADDSSSR